MLKALFVAVMLLGFVWGQRCNEAALLPSAPLPEKSRYIFVVDTSGSMVGEGDGQGRVVFPKVQSEIKSFLDKIPDGSEIWFQPFSKGPGRLQQFQLPEQREAARQYINDLRADGSNTHIYSTLGSVLNQLPSSSKVANTLYLFTDGKDNGPARPSINDVARAYSLKRGDYDWLYYITLGLNTPADVGRVLGSLPGVRTLGAAPNEVPQLTEFTAKPATLDLGNLYNNAASDPKTLSLGVRGKPATLSLEIASKSLESKGSYLTISPTQLVQPGSQNLQFSLANASSLPYGSYSAALCLKGPENVVIRPQAIALRLRYHPPAEYNLKPLQQQVNSTDLARGESATQRFRLEGNQWATETVAISVQGLPQGLEASLNGEPGALRLRQGQEFEVKLSNISMQAGKPAQPVLAIEAPKEAKEANVGSPLSLGRVSQPLTLWERNRCWIILMILLALLLLGYILRRFLLERQPWAKVTLTSAIPPCIPKTFTLVGRKATDLGKISGEITFNGFIVKKDIKTGKPFLEKLSLGSELNAGSTKVTSKVLPWGQEFRVYQQKLHKGSVKFQRI